MKRFFGFTAVIIALFLSSSVFAQSLTFEVGNKKFQAAKNDIKVLHGPYVAASACADLVEDAKDDWSIPSDKELIAMNEQLHKKGVGGFADENYWGYGLFSGHKTPIFCDFLSGQNYWSDYDVKYPDGVVLYVDQNYIITGEALRVRCVRAI